MSRPAIPKGHSLRLLLAGEMHLAILRYQKEMTRKGQPLTVTGIIRQAIGEFLEARGIFPGIHK